MFRIENWSIGIADLPISRFLSSAITPEVNWYDKARDDTYLADPFFAKIGDRSYILCEEFEYRKNKGRIVYLDLMHNVFLSEPKPALELPFHLSYPYTVEDRGHLYCVPETEQNGQISLFENEGSPDKWRKISTIVSGFCGADPTIIRYGDRWWLFSSSGGQYSASKLYIWYCESLTGTWKPHAANPVKTDIRSTRPAGTPFVFDGNLYRPAQNCERTYGASICINKVLELSTNVFREEMNREIIPNSDSPFSDGLHTMAAADTITLLDGKRMQFSLSASKRAIIDLCKRIV